jgi:hypothetical protein
MSTGAYCLALLPFAQVVLAAERPLQEHSGCRVLRRRIVNRA